MTPTTITYQSRGSARVTTALSRARAPFGYLATRAVMAAGALVVVSILVFGLVSLLPGDILVSRLGSQALPEQYQALAAQLGLDRPLWQQYLDWVGGFVRGDWGVSWMRDEPVSGLVIGRLVNSLMLGTVVLVMLIPLSFGLGIISGLRPGGVIDRVVSVLGSALLVVPEFVTGVLLLMLFSVQLKWFPVSSAPPADGDFFATVRVLILPAIPVVLASFGYLARLIRAGTLEVADAAYVRTATLKGLSRSRVIGAHIVRNAVPSSVSVTLLHVGTILGGLVIVEQLFSYSGLGKLIVDSTVSHDTPVLLAAAMVAGALTLAAIILGDIMLLVLDPRARAGAR
ncbi:ABC transporter permease [Herbiconiux daphne]|uniref:ABC transporter permease n=1 Tax=Herbiconiux daphne TaxID=2970914 RepID=A0ABT2H6V8_9MICO|nr:ABC transporter permease [Herbiconiux daphne]MCS5735656.1 ABC transporter permease [Herbiconiux daphne]